MYSADIRHDENAVGITAEWLPSQLDHEVHRVQERVLATWLTQALVALAPVDLPRLDAVRVDWRVALFALGAGSVTLLALGIAPTLSLARTRAAEILADGSREAPARHVAQRTVVAVAIAMAAILVVGAGLLGELRGRDRRTSLRLAAPYDGRRAGLISSTGPVRTIQPGLRQEREA